MKTEFSINPHSGEMVVRGAHEALLVNLQDLLGPGDDVECGQSRPLLGMSAPEDQVRISSIAHGSMVDGPGLRSVVFFQGCPHRCQCHSPHTHSFSGGIGMSIDQVAAELLRQDITRNGTTFSGGEPFVQPEACAQLVRLVKKAGVHIIVYTGFTYEHLVHIRHHAIQSILELADVLVDGPFVARVKDESLAYRGSANQRVIDLEKTRQTRTVRLMNWD